MVMLGAAHGVATAQSRAEVAARDCAVIADATQRLACYDGLFREKRAADGPATAASPASVPASASSPGASASAAAPAAAAGISSAATGGPATVDPVAEFGLTEQQKQRLAPEESRPKQVESIKATVAVAEQDRYGLWRLTLDNGQVWVQTESALGVRLEAGSEVEIRRASLGSFVLKVPGRPMIRVRRVR